MEIKNITISFDLQEGNISTMSSVQYRGQVNTASFDVVIADLVAKAKQQFGEAPSSGLGVPSPNTTPTSVEVPTTPAPPTQPVAPPAPTPAPPVTPTPPPAPPAPPAAPAGSAPPPPPPAAPAGSAPPPPPPASGGRDQLIAEINGIFESDPKYRDFKLIIEAMKTASAPHGKTSVTAFTDEELARLKADISK